jgi:hypothetical protein
MSIKNKKNEINSMLSQIVNEKNKLEKLTKKVINNKHKNMLNNNTKNKSGSSGSGSSGSSGSSNSTNTNNVSSQLTMLKAELEGESEHKLTGTLQIKTTDFKNSSPETVKKILELLKNYIKMDKSFRLKHESLKTLYQAYLDLYKKYKDEKQSSGSSGSNGSNGITIDGSSSSSNSNSNSNSNIPNINNINNIISDGNSMSSDSSDPKHDEMLKNIHTEMKDNNTNLYRERLMILKKIKESPEIEKEMKDKICGRLLILFKAPPVSDYTQLPMLQQNTEEKINVKELDEAYLQKHNELMTVYKAYQSLFNKVLNYKDELDKYKQLPTGSTISRTHMDKLIKDQGFVMNMIDKMQDQLVSKNIISNTEKIPVNPVTSHPQNIETFNNTMRDQIKHIIDRNVDIKPNMKTKIEDLLGQYKNCDSNDQFCQAGRQLLLIKKM